MTRRTLRYLAERAEDNRQAMDAYRGSPAYLAEQARRLLCAHCKVPGSATHHDYGIHLCDGCFEDAQEQAQATENWSRENGREETA